MAQEETNVKPGGPIKPEPPANPPPPALPRADDKGFWWTVFQYLIYVVIGGGALVAIIFSVRGEHSILGDIDKVEVARGLITFMIALTTVVIAIILTLAAILSGGTQYKERFALGKEVLTVLIGVLGTIVGFYFGSSTKTSESANTAATQTQTLQVIPARLSKEELNEGETLSISSFLSGGKPPFKYTITFDPNSIPAIKDVVSQDGILKQDIKIPKVAADTEATFQIDVKDSGDKSTTYANKFRIKAPKS